MATRPVLFFTTPQTFSRKGRLEELTVCCVVVVVVVWDSFTSAVSSSESECEGSLAGG